MSTDWNTNELASQIEARLPGAVQKSDKGAVWITPGRILEVARVLKSEPRFKFDMLTSLTAVDYIEYFEVVYRFRSLLHNTMAVIKCEVGWNREEPEIASVCGVWRGADFMEREVWDLMGIRFTGRDSLKRIFLWEGFPGHPLRKDFANYEQSIVEEE